MQILYLDKAESPIPNTDDQSRSTDHAPDLSTLSKGHYTDEPPPCLPMARFFSIDWSVGNPTATTAEQTSGERSPLPIRKAFRLIAGTIRVVNYAQHHGKAPGCDFQGRFAEIL